MKKSGFKQKTKQDIYERQRKAKERARERAKNKPKKRVVKKKASKSLAKLKKDLDIVFSQYIRNKYAINGKVGCYTCPVVKPIKEMQNGHFISRQYLATRWDEDNCRPQCVGCNVYGNGKFLDFEERLIREIGKRQVELKKRKRHEVWKLDRAWYEERIDYYRKELEKMH